jgi:hypothetical protein
MQDAIKTDRQIEIEGKIANLRGLRDRFLDIEVDRSSYNGSNKKEVLISLAEILIELHRQEKALMAEYQNHCPLDGSQCERGEDQVGDMLCNGCDQI